MALRVDHNGEMRLILKVQDQGSAVIEEFARNSADQLQRAARQTQAATDQVADKTEESTNRLSAAWAFAARKTALAMGVLGTSALGALAGGLKLADSAQNAADKLGVTVEWLTKVQYAAGLADVQLTTVAGAIGQMSRQIAQAAESGKGISATLERIGLTAAELRRTGPQQAFEAILSAIEALPDPMERTRAQMEIFGRQGREIGVLAEALRQAGDDAQRLGLIVSGETGRAADRFYDDVFRLREALKGMGLIVARDVAEPFAALAQTLANFVRDSGALSQAAGAIAIALRGIGAVVVAVGTAFGLAGKALGGFLAIMDALRQGNLREALGIAKETGQELAEVIRKFSELEKLMLGLGGAGGEQKKGGMKKMAFFPGAANDGMFSDVLPGAELITAANDSEAQAMDEHYAAMIARRRSYLLELQQADEEAAKARQQIVDAALQGEASAMVAMANYVSGLMQSKSRTMFQIGKTAAIAEAIISTYQAVNNALALKPFWVGLAMAGVAFAKGMANVQAIRATQFGAQAATPVFTAQPTTGLPAATLGAGEPAAPREQPQQAQPRFTRSETVTLVGDFFSQEWMREKMIPMLNKAQRDGVFLEFHVA